MAKILDDTPAGLRARRLAGASRCLAPLIHAALVLIALVTTAGGANMATPANQVIELTLTAKSDHADPFNEVDVDVNFITPTGHELRVPAFWAGGKTWRVRYASAELGEHRYQSISTVADEGLNGAAGVITVTEYKGDNPLFRHGPIRVAQDKRHFEHADGTPFFWLGDTWWMGLCHRLRFPEDFKKLADDRQKKGFNVVQLVAGLYPDAHQFDPRGANESGFPWEQDYTRINPAYFEAADQRIQMLVDHGLSPCIVGAWGYYLEFMGVEKVQKHWRYLIARYGALPVTWCAAGEANLPWYLVKNFPYHDAKAVNGWTQVLRYIRDTDPFRRPLTIHPTGIGRLSARNATDDVALLDFDMLQTPHGERDAVPPTVNTVRESYADRPVMPVINGEAAYERLGDRIGTEWTRRMFWLCMMNGAAGHTYGANGIWQVNRKGQPHGPSPHHPPGSTGYGVIPWDEAMNLGGSTHVALGKKLFAEFDWQQFKPHPEWASFATKATLSLEGGNWIWFAEGNPAENAPSAKRFFRRTFELPKDKKVTSAQLRITADDRFAAKLNGNEIGGSTAGAESWRTARQFDDITKFLQPGANVLEIEAENLPAPSSNPAGMIAHLMVDNVSIVTDDQWQASRDGSTWGKALVLGPYGMSPWGAFDAQGDSNAFGPQSTGIPGVVRLIYVPDPQQIVLRNLDRGTRHTIRWFDPVTGAKSALPDARADDEGMAIIEPPPGHDHDWVVIVQPKRAERSADPNRLSLQNDQIAWHLDWKGGQLLSLKLDNKLSQHSFAMTNRQELCLVFSAAVDRVAQPMKRVSDFQVVHAKNDDDEATFELRSDALPNVAVTEYVELDGPTRRKWVEVTNKSDKDLLLLDVELDDISTDGSATGGGEGQPVFLENEAFAAIEHLAGSNAASGNRIQLTQFPGRRLPPGATYKSPAALVSVARPGEANRAFIDYIQQRARRPKKSLSIYTPFGINNLWGGAPTCDEEEVLDILSLLEKWQQKGVKFDYFTLDTGWVDPSSDLTKFRPNAFPSGPAKLLARIEQLNMKFGLWFATSWGAQSAWDHPPAFANNTPPGLPWREGYPFAREGVTFCIGQERYHQLLKNAVLHHARQNHVRLFKFDGGDYVCHDLSHGHLPGKYSVEPRMENLIDIANALRAADPEVFIMWYWGLRSPFWALHGDMLFESGLTMEGSATSSSPALYYRDSVTLAQDQNAQHARTIPPIVKDSLGVWLADDRWGNYMYKSRWRESMVMDLGRGNMFAPNLWGDIYYFHDGDVDFLAQLMKWSKRYEPLLSNRRTILGDPWHNEVYGYAYGSGNRSVIFAHNMHFASRRASMRLDASVGIEAEKGTQLDVITHFPDRAKVTRADGLPFAAGDALDVTLRPFETLMLEVMPAGQSDRSLPPRNVTPDLSTALKLTSKPLDPRMDIRFLNAEAFESQGLKKKSYAFETKFPRLEGEQSPILAVVVRLRQGAKEWRHKRPVTQLAQVVARSDDRLVFLQPTPDGRQYGNTQGIEGCSWVTYKVRLSNEFSEKPLQLAVHTHVPDGVEAQSEAWIVKRWWQEDPRPMPNGYYTEEPQ